MRQASHSALHVICGSINDVALENQSLIVRTTDKYIYQHLTENLIILKRALVWQDLDIGMEIQLVERKVSQAEEDIAKLKELVGDYLSIIGGKDE